MLHDLQLIVIFILAFCIGELIAIPIFRYMNRTLSSTTVLSDFSVTKGIIERLLLCLGFISNIPTVVVFFGAIKLGTRLTDKVKEKISNDYFLIGNLVSGTLAILEYLIFSFILKYY
jgi:uncharacterized membrane protein YoaK (UPF0700 family)